MDKIYDIFDQISLLTDKQYEKNGWSSAPSDEYAYRCAVLEMADMIRELGLIADLSNDEIDSLIRILDDNNFHLEAKAVEHLAK